MTTYYIKADGDIIKDYDLTQGSEENNLAKMQEAVGGYIEYAPTNFKNTKVIANEEGLLHDLPQNHIASILCERVIVGNVLVQTSNKAVKTFISSANLPHIKGYMGHLNISLS